MKFSVSLHPDVVKYLISISENDRKRCYGSLKELAQDPYKSRSGCDIKKMKGLRDYYRLRVGGHRFIYIVEGEYVLVEEGFQRGKGY